MNRSPVVFILFVCSMILPIAAISQAADIKLSNACSIADAITAANTDTAVGDCPAGDGPDTIRFAADIPLRAELPEISSLIVIEGEGFRFSGATEYRILYVGPDGELRINNLHLLDGRADDCRWLDRAGNLEIEEESSCGGALLNLGVVHISSSSFSDNSVDSKGGGIYNSGAGELHITGSTFSGNVADYSGGAIHNVGLLTVNYSDFSENTGDEFGGAIDNDGEFSITGSKFNGNSSKLGGAIYNQGDGIIVSSRFSRNLAAYNGGALYNADAGDLDIKHSSFFNNAARDGGAISNHRNGEAYIRGSSFIGNTARDGGGGISNSHRSDISIADSNFSGNSADEGGGIGIFRGGEATLTHVNLVRNRAEQGGGLYADDDPRVRLRNSIIAINRGRDCIGSIDAPAANLIADGSCGTSLLSGDPMLGDLVQPDDGSPPYFPLLEGSPAIDSADSLFCPDTDIIGTPRPQGAGCDIGAYEMPTK